MEIWRGGNWNGGVAGAGHAAGSGQGVWGVVLALEAVWVFALALDFTSPSDASTTQPLPIPPRRGSPGGLPQLLLQTGGAPLPRQLRWIAAPGRTTRAGMAPEEGEQPATGGQQPRHGLQVGRALMGIEGAEAAVLQHPPQAAAHHPGRLRAPRRVPPGSDPRKRWHTRTKLSGPKIGV